MNSVEQYWFNQDADLTDNLSNTSVCPTGAPYTAVNSVPPVCYNGNWPREFVTYKSTIDGSIQHHTLIAQLFNQSHDPHHFLRRQPVCGLHYRVGAGRALGSVPVA